MSKEDEVRDLIDEGVVEVDDADDDPIARVKRPSEKDDDPSDPEGDDKPPTLEEKRDALLKKDDEPKPDDEPPDDEPKSDDEDEVLDWDALMEEHPEIAKLGIKTVEELASRYSGGLGDFQKNQELAKVLKDAGFDSPEKRKELLLTLQSGKVKPTEEAEDTKPKTFAEMRSKALSEHVAKSPMYHTTDDEDNRVPLSEEAQKATVSHLSEVLEAAIPSQLVEGLVAGVGNINQLEEDFLWQQYQHGKVWDGSGGEVISNSVRLDIQKHAEGFPATYGEIIKKAKSEGKNWWEPCHHHFIANTKKDKIDEAKTKKKQEEAEKEAQRRKDAAGSTGAHRTGKSVKTSKDKPFITGSLAEKKARLQKRIGERVQ